MRNLNTYLQLKRRRRKTTSKKKKKVHTFRGFIFIPFEITMEAEAFNFFYFVLSRRALETDRHTNVKSLRTGPCLSAIEATFYYTHTHTHTRTHTHTHTLSLSLSLSFSLSRCRMLHVTNSRSCLNRQY